jgi:hypothetical protein
MKKLLITLLFATATLSATPGFALLAPLHQSVKELDMILSSRELFDYLKPNETIELIKHDGEHYTLRTDTREMIIDVIYLPNSGVGPKEFKLSFHEPYVFFD